MKEALIARQTGELTISSNLNRLNQRSIFMPEPAAAVPVFTKGDIKEGALRLATKETRTRTGEENRPGAVLAKSIEEKRDLNDPESALRELAGQERFDEGQSAEIDTGKGRDFVEKSFVGKYKGDRKGIVREDEEQGKYDSIVSSKGRLESVIKEYASFTDAQKAPIRNQVAHMLRQMPAGEALLSSLPPTEVGPYLDSLIAQSSTELVQVYNEAYGVEPIANNIDVVQANVDKLKTTLKNKEKELRDLKAKKTGSVGLPTEGVPRGEEAVKVKIPTTREELVSLEQDLVDANEEIQLWSGKLIPGKEDTGGFKDRLDQAITRRDALREAFKEGRKGLGDEKQAGETGVTEEKIAKLEEDIYILPREIALAGLDLETAKLDRREGIAKLEERAKNAIPEAVARHLNTAMEQAEQEVRLEIAGMKEKATTGKEKATLEAVEKAISTRYGLKEVITGRNGKIKKVRENHNRTNMYGDTRILIEDGEDVYMAAIIKGVDHRTLTPEQREELRVTTKDAISALKPDDLKRLKIEAQEKLITSMVKADGKLPSGMEEYLLDTKDGQGLIDKVADKRKGMFKGIGGRVSEYFRTMDRKKALKLLLWFFMSLPLSAYLAHKGIFNPFKSGN